MNPGRTERMTHVLCCATCCHLSSLRDVHDDSCAQAPVVIVPESLEDPSSRLIVLDLGRLTLRTHALRAAEDAVRRRKRCMAIVVWVTMTAQCCCAGAGCGIKSHECWMGCAYLRRCASRRRERVRCAAQFDSVLTFSRFRRRWSARLHGDAARWESCDTLQVRKFASRGVSLGVHIRD